MHDLCLQREVLSFKTEGGSERIRYRADPSQETAVQSLGWRKLLFTATLQPVIGTDSSPKPD